MSLTDIAIRNVKPRAKAFKLSDSGGLFLLVTPAGGKLWKLKYRFLGKEKQLALGGYPMVSLAEARERREVAKKQLSAGLDPSETKRQAKYVAITEAGQTFGLIAKEYIERQRAERRAAATITKLEWFLEDLASPISHRPISQITPAEVLSLLKRIEAKGTLESANRLRSAVGRVFRFAIVTLRASHDPTAALKGALLTPRVRHHSAIIDPDRVGELMRAIDGAEGSRVVRAALQIMALCFPRPGELRLAAWSEIDLEAAVWTLPAERTKMRRAHLIPLAPQAVAILHELHIITGRGPLAFPGIRRSVVPMSENTLNAALRRLGYGAEK